ncbi:MAG: FtsW/RodA/SpoVE family cell cycle protein [Coriobacteriia bacterium]|nr:FtsW/RodA/SpoVE family cell cycle protein [Coriobacteriia bacterium]
MRSRRNTELALLAAAAPVVLLIFALVHAQANSMLAFRDLAVPAGLIATFVLAHLALRRLAPAADPVLLPITALLCGTGLAFITRLKPELAQSQLTWIAIGVVAMVGTLVLVPSLERLARYKYTIMLAGIVLLLLPAFIGTEVNGAKLWLRLGPYSFQPAEIAKILIVLFLAAYLAEFREVLSISTRRVAGIWLPPARQLGPLLAMWAVSLMVLVMEKDLGSSLLFFGMFLIIIYVATGRTAYVLAGLVLFSMGASAAYMLFGHVQTRVAIWLDPFADAAGRGYQLVQSLFALAAGGMIGTGIGNGFPLRIPFVETDFIFSAIAEELGLLGAGALLIAYLVFCMRGFATAARARSDMAAFTAAGLTGALALQTFVIVGGVTRFIPLTGITLPFVSYGGSSILSNFILLGLLLRAGDAATGRETEVITTGASGLLGRVALGKRLSRSALVLGLLMVALMANLTYLQVLRADALRNHPANTRGLAAEQRSMRGAILSADGQVLAESIKSDGVYVRRYPQGRLAAHVLGYYSTTYARAGIEAAANDALTGRRAFRSFSDAVDAAAGIPVPGNDVGLTIDTRVQKAAEEALAGRRGAVVAIDPATGAILAMASSPDYDPGSIDDRWKDLSSASDAPLLNRATQSLYPPGSTFKVVTLTGALGAGMATPQTTYPGPGSLQIGGAAVTNYEGGSYGPITLTKALNSSVNTVFAQLAVDLGSRGLVAQAEAFGFGTSPRIEIPSVASLMPDPAQMTVWETAWAGVGQPVGEHDSPPGPQATALQMGLVAAGIANDGVVMRPYLTGRITDQAGHVITSTRPLIWTTATDPITAATLTEMMVGVVQSGSGTRAAIPGVKVAGKTGTAEAGKNAETHAWFIAFAPAENPTVALAIVLENSGVGGRVAAPAARGVLQAALAR